MNEQVYFFEQITFFCLTESGIMQFSEVHKPNSWGLIDFTEEVKAPKKRTVPWYRQGEKVIR